MNATVGTPLFAQPRKVQVHVNILNDKKGDPHVYTIHLSDRCIPAVDVRLDACSGRFYHNLKSHAKGINPHLFFVSNCQVYDLGGEVYELRPV